MDPKKVAKVAKAFREAEIDAQDVPETMALIVVAFAREVAKISDPRDADTLIFMTMDQLLSRWQSVRSVEAPVECGDCLAELSDHVPADFWVIAKTETKEERFSCCDAHAARRRDELLRVDPRAVDVHLERIRR